MDIKSWFNQQKIRLIIPKFAIVELDKEVPYFIAKYWLELPIYQKEKYLKYRSHSGLIESICDHYNKELLIIEQRKDRLRIAEDDSDSKWIPLEDLSVKTRNQWKEAIKLAIT